MCKVILTNENELNSIIEIAVKNAVEKALSQKTVTKAKSNNRTNVQGVAARSGYKPNTIYRLVHENKIPYHKPLHGGRKLIFYINEIESWLEGKNAETTDEYCERMENKLFSK